MLLPINCRPIGAIQDHLVTAETKNAILLWRSASIDKTPEARATLYNELCIECHLDLRNSDEVDPAVLCASQLVQKNFSMVDPEQLIRNSINGDYKTYGQSYINLLLFNVENIIHLIKFMIFSDYRRFVISCYAGKDRTGIISAIILLMFDMPQWLIHADYVMSTAYLLPHIQAFSANWKKRNIPREIYQNRFKADPRALQYFLHYFTCHYDGLLNYLKQHGLSDADVDLFNKKFHVYKLLLMPQSFDQAGNKESS